MRAVRLRGGRNSSKRQPSRRHVIKRWQGPSAVRKRLPEPPGKARRHSIKRRPVLVSRARQAWRIQPRQLPRTCRAWPIDWRAAAQTNWYRMSSNWLAGVLIHSYWEDWPPAWYLAVSLKRPQSLPVQNLPAHKSQILAPTKRISSGVRSLIYKRRSI